MAEYSYTAVQVSNCIILIGALIALGSLLFVIGKYLIKRDQKIFVTLFYCFAVPLMITDIIYSMNDLTNMEKVPSDTEAVLQGTINLCFHVVIDGLHDVFYIGMVLSMISGIATISTGL